MEYPIRDYLSTEFATIIEDIRERKWEAFSEAAEESDLEPYIALSRLLVRLVEETLEG